MMPVLLMAGLKEYEPMHWDKQAQRYQLASAGNTSAAGTLSNHRILFLKEGSEPTNFGSFCDQF